VLAGLMRTAIRTLVFLTFPGVGGVAGEVVGDEVGDMASAGACLGLTYTIPGGRCLIKNLKDWR
jgi:hypothetical protein